MEKELLTLIDKVISLQDRWDELMNALETSPNPEMQELFIRTCYQD